ncbi:hypothetical protein MKP08_00695 [Erythrobacter sp. LQ02-29]|uniref:hypothetical protein n=1 Tax=Erythrobacter sp. LQ02-29 TaxID=2920384 RepID=UPI001F4EFA1E|nr:hypothetical protein [Erythrobacter sp. LQ02-29]MCP9221267.1 hypothetical protein [Erythrobacter sp. LQ02-29]
MQLLAAFIIIGGAVSLVACSANDEPQLDQPRPTGEVAKAESPATPVSNGGDAGDLGLENGVYDVVAGDGQCTTEPPLATVNTFDGKGFGTRNFGTCVFTWDRHEGRTYTGSQTCTDSQSKERVTEELAITVLGPTRYTRAGGGNATATYGRCTGVDESSYGL